MAQKDLEAVRHQLEKGKMLAVLATEYGGVPVSVRTLWGALDRLGYPLSGDNVQFALTYLAEQGLVAITRARDTAGFRSDRAPVPGDPDVIVTVKLTAKGLQLVDGVIAADPLVKFE